MRKFLLGLVLSMVLAASNVFAVAATNVMIHKGDNDGFYGYMVNTSTVIIIANNTVPTAAIPDWVIQNYSTNTYSIEISTCQFFRDATVAVPSNYWILVPGESISPQGALLYAPVFVRSSAAAGTTRQRVQVNKFKYSQIR